VLVQEGKMVSKKQKAAALRNIKKARKKWMKMSLKSRRKAMPGRRKGKYKKYPVGQIITIDVGRPKHHYIHAKKTKHGWIAGSLKKYKKRKH